MVALILFSIMDTNHRRVVINPINNGSPYSAPNKKDEVKENKSTFFINFDSKRIIYVDKKGNVAHAPYTSFIFPPISWDDTVKDLRDRDELREIDKKEFVKQITKRYENVETELNDLKQLILSIINDL